MLELLQQTYTAAYFDILVKIIAVYGSKSWGHYNPVKLLVWQGFPAFCEAGAQSDSIH